MKKAVLGVSLPNQIRSIFAQSNQIDVKIRKRTKVTDLSQRVAKSNGRDIIYLVGAVDVKDPRPWKYFKIKLRNQLPFPQS